MSRPILIVQGFVSPVFMYGERRKEWLKVYTRNKHVSITRKEAMRLIEERGLVSVLKNEYGEVFDTPERDFQKRWKR